MLPESLARPHNRSIFFKKGKYRNSLFHTTAKTSNIAFQGRPTANSYYQSLFSGARGEVFQAIALFEIKECCKTEQATSEQDQAAGLRRKPN